jgi:hypothetical protein
MTTMLALALSLALQQKESEESYYPMLKFPLPPGCVLEAGGIAPMPDGKTVAVSTRRGEIWMLADAWNPDPSKSKFSLWAQGLHEVLGLAWHDGWLWAQQRGEFTKVKDSDGDGRADTFRTVNAGFEISGDYHEYAFSTPPDKDGNFWAVLCLTGSFSSNVPFRGWCVRYTPDGKMIPTCSGIRSPGGMGMNAEGDVFYCDNQGPWNGTSSLKWLKPGSFQGHPDGNKWYSIAKEMGPRPPDPKSGSRFHVEMQRIPEYVPPAVLLPHGKVGNSASGGKFGPFGKQLFVSDQSFSQVNRCFLEKIGGRYQGACFEFRRGFGSGNVPTILTPDGSLWVGGTNRGWGSRGTAPGALDRVTWSGKVPFEVLEMRSKKDGFELVFTQPVDPALAGEVKSYAMKSWTYIFQSAYGSPEVDPAVQAIKSATVSADGLRVQLIVDNLQIGSIHELKLAGIRSAEAKALLHDTAWYTLWALGE